MSADIVLIKGDRFKPFRRGQQSLAHLLSLMHNWRSRPEPELDFLLPRVQRGLRNVPPEYGQRAADITRAFLMHMGAYSYGSVR